MRELEGIKYVSFTLNNHVFQYSLLQKQHTFIQPIKIIDFHPFEL